MHLHVRHAIAYRRYDFDEVTLRHRVRGVLSGSLTDRRAGRSVSQLGEMKIRRFDLIVLLVGTIIFWARRFDLAADLAAAVKRQTVNVYVSNAAADRRDHLGEFPR